MNDEIENLKIDLQLAEDDINYFLVEIDNLRDRLDGSQKANEELHSIVEATVERAEKAESKYAELEVMHDHVQEDLRGWINSHFDYASRFYTTLSDLNDVQDRANSWFEIAKDLIRKRDSLKAAPWELERSEYRELVQQWQTRADKAEGDRHTWFRAYEVVTSDHLKAVMELDELKKALRTLSQ